MPPRRQMSRFPQPVLSVAFRPFFLLAGLSAVVSVIYWMLALNGLLKMQAGVNPLYWHGHEMIVGFAMATVAGFVLTAVATWTGRPALSGWPLVWLAGSFLLGRMAMLGMFSISPLVVATLDMLFPLSLLYFSAREIIGARNRRNYKVVVIIAVLVVSNLAYHLADAYAAMYLLIHTILLLVALIGGRIVPNFTANWLRGQGAGKLPANNLAIDRMAISLTIILGITVVIYPDPTLVGYLAMSAAALHAARVSQWRGLQTIRNPLLFMLHVAYCWLPIGYAMMGMAGLGWAFTPTAALHALTMGGIGSMVIAMITRVPLGHTGRPLHASRLVVAAYAVLTLAVMLRIVSPWVLTNYLPIINVAAAGWCLAFAIFLWVYWPVLTKPRVNSA